LHIDEIAVRDWKEDCLMCDVINNSTPRLDAWEKVTGRAKYGADLHFERMLYAAGVYAEYPHAKILCIHTEEAQKTPGVAAVITAKDIPGLKVIGEVMLDQYILADDKTRFFGDVVACVAAETLEIARSAAKKVVVDY
jgi:CO/xanthine dehydrogenase Mo-binding subunit